MIKRQEILRMINQPEEKLLCAKVLDQADFSLTKHEQVFTDFMDMAKASRFLEITKAIAGLNGVAFGGIAGCERQRLCFAPDYMEIQNEDFPITALTITKNKKFGQSDLSHGDYLGSLLGLGIDRAKTGDILVMEEETVCFVVSEISDYVIRNLTKVSRTPVKVDKASVAALQNYKKQLEYRSMTVPSLRLDAVVGAAFRLSRGKAQDLIRAEKAQVNWTMVASPAFVVKQGDLISLRGFGRFRLEEISGRTKKDRIGITVGMY